MATLKEYVAVYGQEPPAGKTAATEFGDGGCHLIYKDKGAVVGRWTDYTEASQALVKLQQIGIKWEYRLEESHHWVHGLTGIAKCSKCGHSRDTTPMGRAMGIEWPVAR